MQLGQQRGGVEQLAADLARGLLDRVAGEQGLAGRRGRARLGRPVGVGGDDPDVERIDAQFFGGELGDQPEHALADLDRARVDLDHAVFGDPHSCPRGVGVAVAVAEPEADRAHAPTATQVRGRGRIAAIGPARTGERGVHAVDRARNRDDLAGGHALAVAQQVLALELDDVHAEPLGQGEHGPFVGDRQLAGTKAPHRPGRRVVGEDRDPIDRDVGHAIGPGRVADGLAQHGRPGRRIGPFVAADRHFGGGDRALGRGRERVVDLHRVALVSSDHRLGAGVLHPNRAPELHGREPEIDLDRDVLAPAEGTAGRRLNHANPLERHAERHRDQPPVFVDPLARDMNLDPILDQLGVASLDVEEGVIDRLGARGRVDHDLGLGDRSGGVALADQLGREHVAADVQRGRVEGLGLGHGPDHRQRLVVDHHPIAGLLGGGLRGRDHDPEHVAAIADLLRAQDRVIAADQPVHVGALDVGGGQHSNHARRDSSRADVDLEQARVRMRAANHDRAEHLGPGQIAAVAGLAGDLAEHVGPRGRAAEAHRSPTLASESAASRTASMIFM